MSNPKRNHISKNFESTNTPERDASTTIVLTAEQLQSANQEIPENGDETIRELAYGKWEASGCPTGDGLEFWLQAEQEVKTAESGEDRT